MFVNFTNYIVLIIYFLKLLYKEVLFYSNAIDDKAGEKGEFLTLNLLSFTRDKNKRKGDKNKER